MQPGPRSVQSRFPGPTSRRWDPVTFTSDPGSWEQGWDSVLNEGMVMPLWPLGRPLPSCSGCATRAPFGAKMLGFLPPEASSTGQSRY